jgi:hypothetical protein
MDEKAVNEYIDSMPDEVLSRMCFAVPWQVASTEIAPIDPDGFPVSRTNEFNLDSYKSLQEECWKKFNKSPHIRTSITDTMGRLCGDGFGHYSDIEEIQDVIDEILDDDRNRLHTFMPKYVARAEVEGELFLTNTLHRDGFVEIDFNDPGTITDVHYHPNKPSMPLLFDISGTSNINDILSKKQIPSIYLARYPELWDLVKNVAQDSLLKTSRTTDKKFKSLNGYFRFIVNWDKSFLTKRNISHVSTTLEWLNHYENLKKYEIDHKKSSGAYVWVFQCTDPKMFRIWLSLTDEQRADTGITAKKTPGSSIVLPPGFEMKAVNPNLTKISDTDTDILSMVVAGLNKPADIVTGESKGTFASVNASRGPLADRLKDEISYFETFLRYDFWSSIFFLRSKVTNFPTSFKVKRAVSFDKNKEPVMKLKAFTPHKLMEFSFPTSSIDNLESEVKALLGVKHGRLSKTLGIPNAKLAAKIGFSNYKRLRLETATEDYLYPELEPDVDSESLQEIEEGEVPKGGVKKTPKNEEGKPIVKKQLKKEKDE